MPLVNEVRSVHENRFDNTKIPRPSGWCHWFVMGIMAERTRPPSNLIRPVRY
ncbi:hypothetical protein ROE7235_03881 [Roseibaca ekhonensis]|uniref:Uncharacterized protein n=1 Tax=Roseinatronobacter ekhonensis TaxID=254356 RepID=A0A3B0MWF4_9RHOB|nr:hypothetical protein ROE7235_03881 [Roseibaca ekhonensis]